MLNSFSKECECENCLLVRWNKIEGEVDIHLHKSVLQADSISMIDVGFVDPDLVVSTNRGSAWC